MEVQLQQRFGSPSADLGVMASLPSGLFAERGRATASKKAERPDAARSRRSSQSAASVNLEFDEVVARLKRGDQLTPNDSVAAFNLGYAYKVLGRWAESAEAYTKALEFLAKTDDKYRDRNLALTYYMRGYAYASLATKQKGDEARENFEKAERDYLEAIRLKKDYMLVYCYLGVLYGEQRRWDEAEKAFKKAIKLKPRYGGAHHDLGAIYMLSGRPRLALKAFERAVEYEPKNLLSLKHLGEAYYEAARWEDARKILLRVIKLDPEDQDALYKLGGVYLEQGKFRQAEKALLKVLELDPVDAMAYGNLGLVYFQAGWLEDAADAFKRALELGHRHEEGIRGNLNAVQLLMLTSLANACLEDLSNNHELDVDQLVEYLAYVQAKVSPSDQRPLDTPAAYFPNQLMGVFGPVVEQLDEDSCFLFAAKLFERGLLSSGKASRLIGMDRVTFLTNLHKVGVAVIDLDEEQMESQARYVNSR